MFALAFKADFKIWKGVTQNMKAANVFVQEHFP